MPSNTFTPGQLVTVHHQDGRGLWADHDGVIVENVSDTIWRVQMMGLRVLWSEQYIKPRSDPDAIVPSNAQI